MIFLSNMRQAWVSLGRERRWFVFWVVTAAAGLAMLAVPAPKAGKAAARLAEAHAAGHAAGTADYVMHWVPRAAQGGLVVAGLLLLGTRWLVGPVPADGAPPLSRPGRRAGWALLGFTGLMMLYSGWANAPRLHFGLWGDEESTMRKTVVGQFQRGKEGKLEWDAVSWQETFFRYKDPNNHPLNSVLARLSHEWLAGDLTRPEGFYFEEKAMRLPVFGAGLLGLGALAWVGWVLGRPGLGALAVLLMAAHPWFIRYGVEARGYGFLFLLTPLALVSLVKAAAGGRWRWWLIFGFCQFLLLWSYPGAVHLLMALNGAVLTLIFGLKGPSREWRRAQAGRWLTAIALGAVLCTLLMLPLVQPLYFYLKSARMQGPMPGSWYGETLVNLITGVPVRPWDQANPLCWSWEQQFVGHPALAWCSGAAALGLLGGGALGWWRAGGIPRAMLPALVLHPVLFLLQTKLTGGFVYTWYLLPGLTGLLLLAGGMAFFSLRWGGAPALAAAGLFWWVTRLPAHLLRTHPIEQMKEGTMLTRSIRLPSDARIDEIMTVDLIMTTRGYDPAVLPLASDDPVQFQKYLAEADASNKPLFVHLGSPGFAVDVRPQVMALVNNPAWFELVATLPGMDAPYTRQVFRYRPGSRLGNQP